MKTIREILVFACFAVALFWGLSVAHSSLPAQVSYDNVEINPNASTASRMFLRAMLSSGAAPQRVEDYPVFRTATVQFGDREVHFVALPGTKWMAL